MTAERVALEDDGDRVRCWECGRAYRSLATHLRLAHDLTAAQYRQRWDLLRTLPLESGATAARRAANNTPRRIERATEELRVGVLEPRAARGWSHRASGPAREVQREHLRALGRSRRAERPGLTCLGCGVLFVPVRWAPGRADRPRAAGSWRFAERRLTCGLPLCHEIALAQRSRSRP